jgi:CubicO group peptidase (beta-lactamase class C family)
VNEHRAVRKFCDREKTSSGGDMANNAQKFRPNNSRNDKLVFLTAALGALMLQASIYSGIASAPYATEPVWPTKEWQTSIPEEQGMDSRELAELVDFGAMQSFDSLLVVRHGKIVVEAYYAPYAQGIPHTVYSVTKAVIRSLTAIACKEGLLDSPDHRMLEFFDYRSIGEVDSRKEAITVQDLLDMTSGIAWMEPSGGRPDSMFEMERSPDWVKFVLDRPMSSVPGEAFYYNSGNPHLLSASSQKSRE